jgi:membrane-bound metal-dependent hydrolase YbcI (DUF457 family)
VVAFNAKQHVAFTIIVYVYIVAGRPELLDVINPIWLVVGSIFPDCDHRFAPMGRILPLWLWCKHRGFTHSWFGIILFTIIVAVFNKWWGLSFFFGYFSHLFFDSMTPSGVNWLWLKRKAYPKR